VNERTEITRPENEDAFVRRRRRKWPWVLLFLAAAVYAAPWILSINGVAQSVTRQAMPWLPEGSNLGKPSLGWMSPVHLAGLRIVDEEGRMLLECDHVTSQKSLWEMATSPLSPGGWVLEKPRVVLHVDPRGSNLNPVLQKFLARKRCVQTLNFDVKASDGRIEFRDPSEAVLATVENVSLNYVSSEMSQSASADGLLKTGDHQGRIVLDGRWIKPGPTTVLPSVEANATIGYLPLSLFEPWLQSNSTITQVAGGGEVSISISSLTTGGEPDAMTARGAFRPADAVYRRNGQQKPESVPPMELVVEGRWEENADRVAFQTLRATSGAVTLSGRGLIEQVSGPGIIDLRATADQDISGLLDLLNPVLRRHIVVRGLKVRDLEVTGALWPDRFVPRESQATSPAPAMVAGDITWSDAVLYGMQASPGSVTAAWTTDAIALWPREVRISDGELRSLPQVQLVDSRRLVAPQGPMLLNVNIIPEMCREWLKFVSPIVADATAVEGKLTLVIDSGSLPLANPGAAEVAGTVKLQAARVTPGPLAQEALKSVTMLARLITQKDPPWAGRDLQLDLPPQDIAFRVHDGRVYHQGFTFRAGDLAVVTRGSVGLDHSLDLLVEIPLPDSWLDRGPVLRSLKGEVVAIPLQGTLEQPRVDGRTMAELGKRLGAEAAGGLLQNLLERGLDRAAEKGQRRRERRNAP
jgi:hypothetical protein